MTVNEALRILGLTVFIVWGLIFLTGCLFIVWDNVSHLLAVRRGRRRLIELAAKTRVPTLEDELAALVDFNRGRAA